MRRFFLTTALAALAAFSPTWVLADDAETAKQVAEAIRASGRLQDYSIGVKFEEGRAFLMGRVASRQQAEAAVEMTQSLPYVKEVENHLEIKSTPKQDFAVEPTAHNESSRRTVNRDEAVFGSSSQPTPPQMASVPTPAPLPHAARAPQAAQPVRRVSNNAAAAMNRQNTGAPIPTAVAPSGVSQRVAYDQPHLPCYSWPSYAAHPNYAAVTYPNQYSAAAWPYIGPFYPYPQVPLGWRKVTLEWKDGWWFLDFNDHCRTFRK